jgi:hypothetical protein
MKKILFAAFAALSMIACNKDDATTVIPDIDNTLNGAIVAMRFTDETPTRAFFAEAAAAEAWEKSLSSLSVYVFNAKGDLITLRDFTASELTARTATFALPHATAGTTCDFYAVANLSLTGVTTKSALLAKMETSAADYNGTFAEVSTQAKRSGGFVMTAGVSKAIAEGGTTSIALTLNGRKRKIQKSDFVKVMTASGLSEKVINNIAKKFRRSIVKWLDLIEASFLPDSMKKEYKKLILSRVMALR